MKATTCKLLSNKVSTLVKFRSPLILLLGLLFYAPPASAGFFDKVLNSVLNSAQISAAKKSWSAEDASTKTCLRQHYNIDTEALAQSGVTTSDNRVVQPLTQCRQEAQLERRQRETAEQAQRERQREKARAAANARKAQEEAAQMRQQELVDKYGAEHAALISSGKVKIGMRKDEVRDARGEPDRREFVPPTDELWYYGNDQIIISAGKVTYIGLGNE